MIVSYHAFITNYFCMGMWPMYVHELSVNLLPNYWAQQEL